MKTVEKQNKSESNFHFAASLIQLISFAIALFMVVISRYAAIFFVAAMLPTIIAVFFDRNNHRCASATICTFNLVGVMPYLIRLWDSPSINSMAKMIIADVDTWMIIYVTAFVGQLLYVLFPLFVVKIYSAKAMVQANALEKRRKKLCEEWDIKPDALPQETSTSQ